MLTSHVKVIKIGQEYFLWTFWDVLVTIKCDIVIFLWTSSIVKLFDFLIYDTFMFLTW